MKNACLLLVGLLCAKVAQAEPGTLRAVEERKVLRVGMYPGVSPFVAAGADAEELRRLLGEHAPPERHATDGRPVCGFDVELVAEAAHALGASLEVTLVGRFDELLPGLREGKYDLVASALTRTLDRAVHVAFTDPYFASGLVVLVRDTARLPSVESLRRRDVRVGARAGTTAESFAREELRGASLNGLDSDAALFAAIAAGRLDAIVLDYVTARDASVRGRAGKELQTLEERRLTSEHFAFAVRQGDADWLGWLNLFLKQEKSSGAFHRLAARFNAWFRNER